MRFRTPCVVTLCALLLPMGVRAQTAVPPVPPSPTYPGTTYTQYGVACPSGDGASQIPLSNGQCLVAVTPPGGQDVRAWGALCDGINDDGPAINLALAASAQNGAVVIPNLPGKACRSSVPIVIPYGAQLAGQSFSPNDKAPVPSSGQPYPFYAGSTLRCDVNVDPCVSITVDDSQPSSSGGQILRNLTITSAAATDATIAGDCVKDGSFKVTIENVKCDGFANGFHLYGQEVYGLATVMDHVWTCDITGSHIILDGYAELRVNQSRFGCVASFRGARSSLQNYILITQTYTGGSKLSPGPNGLYIVNSQFNDQPNANCFMRWAGFMGIGGVTSEYTLVGNHLEFTGGTGPYAVFCSDSSAKKIVQMNLSGNLFLDNSNAGDYVWKLDPTTEIDSWVEHGNIWQGFGARGWTFAPGAAVYNFVSSGEVFVNPLVTVTGSGQQFHAVFEGDDFVNGLAVTGSFAGRPRFSGIVQTNVPGVSVTSTATTPVEIDIPGYSFQNVSSSVGVAFGNTPATLNAGAKMYWQIHGSTVEVRYIISLASLGAGTGAAELTGLPFNVPSTVPSSAQIAYCQNMSGLVSPVFLLPNAGTTTAAFTQSGSAGVANLSQANFTTSTVCVGEVRYSIQ